LLSEKAIESIPRRGFFVRQLSIDEAKEIYSVRPLLEPEALRLAGLPSNELIDSLMEINSRFAAAVDARAAIFLDDEWHSLLVRNCPNRTLVDMLMHVIHRTHRYEFAVMGQPEVLASSAQQHDEIISVLRNGDLELGCTLLKGNLSGLEPVLRWLRANEGKSGRTRLTYEADLDSSKADSVGLGRVK
jgi:DNA-binding GntR family transcriptional regulator